MSSSSGILKYNRLEGGLRSYLAYDQSNYTEFTNGAVAQVILERCISEDLRGITAFHPKKIQSNQDAPDVVLKDFYINGQLQSPHTEDAILSNVLRNTQEIELPYDKSNFSLSFCFGKLRRC